MFAKNGDDNKKVLQHFLEKECIGFVWLGFGTDGLQGWLLESLLEASSTSSRVNPSQLQDGHTTGKG